MVNYINKFDKKIMDSSVYKMKIIFGNIFKNKYMLNSFPKQNKKNIILNKSNIILKNDKLNKKYKYKVYPRGISLDPYYNLLCVLTSKYILILEPNNARFNIILKKINSNYIKKIKQ